MFRKASQAVFSISRLNSSIAQVSSLRFSHSMKSSEPETDQEKLDRIFEDLVREDIDHFGEDGFCYNPDFANEIKERFGIEVEKPANLVANPTQEQLQRSQNQSKSKIK